MALCSAALLLPVSPAQATTTLIFNPTGAEQTFEVPAGVYQIQFVAIGGDGGEANGPAGGEAAEVKGTLEVDQFQTLYVEVGGNGKKGSEGGEGGFNGGGDGGGGGGGASDIRTASRSVPLSTEDTRLVVAAGGGGGGSTNAELGGPGGAAGEPGGATTYPGGGAGTSTEGGEGAFGCEIFGAGTNGELGQGGNGGYSAVETGPGGGGGGGYYGGGGGGGACIVGSSGGGGGSSLIPSLGQMTTTSAQPKIEISYNLPPSITITTPAEEAAYTQGQAINANYSCQPGEGTSVKTCAGPVANGAPLETATVGEHEFLVKAEDNDKGKAGRSVNYMVFGPPSVMITAPAGGATFSQGQVVNAAYSCAAVEGRTVKSCAGPAASGAAIDTATAGPHSFTVVAKDDLGGETSKTVDYTVMAPASPPTAVPDTILSSHPKKTVKTKKKKAKVKFSFSSDLAGATFECKLDRSAFAPCSSPKSYKVKKGKHTFSVEAVGPAGTDATPATFSFKVKKKK
ncbi:MAG TPA: glycine-rich protein [Solirubrobacterales bacterium]